VSSKYDTFWQRQLPELRNAVERAADGRQDELVISEIRSLGERASWHGTAVIQGASVLPSSMAHMRSLANGIVDAALCTAWPETTFRFATLMDLLGEFGERPDGTVLTVIAQPGRSTPSGSAMPEAARRSVPRRLEPLMGTATHQSGAETSFELGGG